MFTYDTLAALERGNILSAQIAPDGSVLLRNANTRLWLYTPPEGMNPTVLELVRAGHVVDARALYALQVDLSTMSFLAPGVRHQTSMALPRYMAAAAPTGADIEVFNQERADLSAMFAAGDARPQYVDSTLDTLQFRFPPRREYSVRAAGFTALIEAGMTLSVPLRIEAPAHISRVWNAPCPPLLINSPDWGIVGHMSHASSLGGNQAERFSWVDMEHVTRWWSTMDAQFRVERGVSHRAKFEDALPNWVCAAIDSAGMDYAEAASLWVDCLSEALLDEKNSLDIKSAQLLQYTPRPAWFWSTAQDLLQRYRQLREYDPNAYVEGMAQLEALAR